MQHLVNISIAPVLVVIDDCGDPVETLIVGPVSLLFFLPALLYTAWLRLGFLVSDFKLFVSDYLAGWAADLALMAEAARLLVAGAGGCFGSQFENSLN